MIVTGYFDVDLVAATLAFLVAWFGDAWAGPFALGTGILLDVLSASPLGLFSVIHLLVFLGIRMGEALFDLHSARGQMMVVAMAVLLKKLLFLGFLGPFSLEAELGLQVMLAFGSSAVFTGLAAPPMFFLLESISGRLVRAGDERGEP